MAGTRYRWWCHSFYCCDNDRCVDLVRLRIRGDRRVLFRFRFVFGFDRLSLSGPERFFGEPCRGGRYCYFVGWHDHGCTNVALDRLEWHERMAVVVVERCRPGVAGGGWWRHGHSDLDPFGRYHLAVCRRRSVGVDKSDRRHGRGQPGQHHYGHATWHRQPEQPEHHLQVRLRSNNRLRDIDHSNLSRVGVQPGSRVRESHRTDSGHDLPLQGRGHQLCRHDLRLRPDAHNADRNLIPLHLRDQRPLPTLDIAGELAHHGSRRVGLPSLP